MSASKASAIGSVVAITVLSGVVFSQGISREVPLGRVQGTVVSKGSGKPVPHATVTLRLTGQDFQDRYDLNVPRRVTRTDDKGQFYARNLPEGSYEVSAYSANFADSEAKLDVKGAATTTSKIELESNAPYVNLYVAQHVFMPSEKVTLHLNGWLKASAAHVSVYRLNDSAYKGGKDLGEILRSLVTNRNQSSTPTQQMSLSKKVDDPLNKRDDEGVFNQELSLDNLAEGVYYAKVTFDQEGAKPTGDRYYEDQRGTYILVSKIGLVAKVDHSKVVAYVAELDSGKPIPGAQIGNAGDQGIQNLTTTNEQGLAEVPLSAFPKQKIKSEDDDGETTEKEGSLHALGLVARLGDSTAFIGSTGNAEVAGGSLMGHIFSDRPVYRPGDTIKWKGILRMEDKGHFSVPGGKAIHYEVKNPDGDSVGSGTLTSSGQGSVTGEFKTDPEQTGEYTVNLESGGQKESQYFIVDTYRKPEFKMTVEGVKKKYYVGDTVEVKVHCEYYFGGPVVGAKVNAYGDNRPYYPWWSDYEGDDSEGDYSGGDGGYGGDLNGVTDDQGDVILTYKPDKDNDWTSDRQVTFNVNATESGDKYFDGSGSVILMRGDETLDVQPDLYVVPAKSQAPVTTTVLDSTTQKPVNGANVVLMYGHDEWVDQVATFHRDGSVNGTTDVNGKAHFTVPSTDAAEIALKAQVTDSAGHVIKAESSIYVSGTQDRGAPAGELEIYPDKKEYHPGDTAHVLIRTGKTGGSVLLTLEGDGVISYKTLALGEQAQMVDVPLDDRAFPNASISISRIRDKQFHSADKSVKLRVENKRLKVSVKAAKDTYKPGEDAVYSVDVRDANGQPVSTEVALGIVDESIYAIRKDSSDPYKSFYPHRDPGVNTLYSFPELYLDGGDKTVTMTEIRKDFKDTAYWNPVFQTDPSGHAEVTVHLPDNLTSWRATATAVSDQTQCGKAISNVQVRKDLMVRLSMPLYLVRGDEVRISALITNNTGTEKPVEVTLNAPGMDVEGQLKQTVNASPTQGTQVTWIARPKQLGSFDITTTAVTNGANDGMQLPILITPRGLETVESHSAILKQVSTTFEVNRTADNGQLTIRMEPSATAVLGGTIESLVEYPYGCVEQTLSRFVPAVAVRQAFGSTLDPKLNAKIDEVSKRSLRRLGKMQHGDGGFGWWEQGDSEPEMTGLVLEGLWRARNAGVQVPDTMISRARQWSEGQFKVLKPISNEYWEWEAEGRLQFLLGYARWGWNDAARPVLKDLEGRKLGPAHMAMLAMIQQLSNAPDHAQGSLAAMKRMADESHDVAQWPGADQWGSGGTARCLQALDELAPNDPLIEQTINYLWQSRRADGWVSTRDTAQVIFGLVPWLQGHNLQSVSSYTVQVNGKPVAQGSEAKIVKIPMTELARGANKIEILKSGDLNAFLGASVLAKQVPEPSSLGASSTGISVDAGWHALEVAHLPDGAKRLVSATSSSSSFKSGDPVRYVITLNTKTARDYVMVRIPRPSNLFISDTADAGWWRYSWSGMQVFDDHVALFVRHLEPGQTTLEVNFHAEAPGKSVALPVTAYCMYVPDIRGQSASIPIEVR